MFCFRTLLKTSGFGVQGFGVGWLSLGLGSRLPLSFQLKLDASVVRLMFGYVLGKLCLVMGGGAVQVLNSDDLARSSQDILTYILSKEIPVYPQELLGSAS